MAGVRTVHIVLDTNSLFTDAEDKLLASNISRFILEDTKHLGLQIIWHLPDVVKGERKRQMLERASILVAKLGKLEALLGTPLGIDPATLEKKVDEAIAKQIKHHNLEELRADNSKIDWDQLIQNSVERNAPFSQSTEKGFRDAIILESFFQLIGSQSGTTWRAFLVSNDDRMTEAAEQRIKTQFASTVADLDELKSAINAIPAHVSKAELSKLIPAAHAYCAMTLVLPKNRLSAHRIVCGKTWY